MPRILVVEDEVVVAKQLEQSLAIMGYEVVGTATSGADAVELTRDLLPDVILMDIVMPGKLDGIAAAERIKEELNVGVIFLTAYAEDKLIRRAKRVGPFGYIVKPFHDEELRAAIEVATYKNEMEQRLRDSEERYRRIVDTAQEGIYVVDTDVKIDFVNRQLAEMLGYTAGEMVGRYLIDFMDDLAPVGVYETHYWDKETIKEPHDFRFRRKDGSDLWGMISSSAICDDAGRFVGALGMVIDVTERKQAERALRKTNEELSNFVDTVSHDLKNPILSIRGFSSLLLRNYEKKLGDKGRGYLEVIEACARQMDCLVSDLLTLSSLGQVVPKFRSVISHELVYKAVSTLQGRLDEMGIELVVAQKLPIIYCDRQRMYQVFENLISNAIRFAGHGKKPEIEIGYEDEREYHKFYVRDNGVGIDAKHHRKIFEMFHRVQENENEEGTGMGLAIVDRIVRQHSGKIWVESQKGEGATFYFTLPTDLAGVGEFVE
jgi:PAS domain S-box-containing protein